MRVTAWTNGSPTSSGAGYGLRLAMNDRDHYFLPSWDHIIINLGEHQETVVRLSASFWANCTELRSAAVGRWLLDEHLAPWPKGDPPGLLLQYDGGNKFPSVEDVLPRHNLELGWPICPTLVTVFLNVSRGASEPRRLRTRIRVSGLAAAV